VSPYIAVPIGALFLIGITVTGKFSTWERMMFVILGGNALVIPWWCSPIPPSVRSCRVS